MPINERRYALFERFRGTNGNIASTATTNTQALTENCIVCRSQRKEVGFEAEVADALEVLVEDPVLRGRGCSLVVDEPEDGVDCLAD